MRRCRTIIPILALVTLSLVGCRCGEVDIPEPEIPANQIISYTAAEEVSPTGSFGLAISEREFTPEGDGGYGRYIFAAPVFMVGPSTFKNNTNLWTITLPEEIVSLGDYAFRKCTSLRSVTLVGDKVEYLGEELFFGCTSLEGFATGDIVQEIKPSTFEGCASLATIGIGESVTTLSDDAFGGCSALKEIDLPESVDFIGNNCFKGCSSLAKIYLRRASSVVEVGYKAFEGCSSELEIYVPAAMLESYQNDFLWKSLGYVALIKPISDTE